MEQQSALALKDLNDNPPKSFNYKVNKHEARLMAIQGASFADIARHFGVTTSAISQMLHKEREHIQAYLAFKKDPATLYEYKESMLVHSLDDSDIKEMSGYQKVGSAGLIRDKVRLERGQATSINVTVMADLLEAVRQMRDK